MPRERLPDRRQSETVDLHYGGRRYHLSIGEYPSGQPGETFLHGAKQGSDVDLLCGDIAVLMSRLLQHGDDPASLAAGVGRLGNGEPASIIGAIADVLARKAALPQKSSPRRTSINWMNDA